MSKRYRAFVSCKFDESQKKVIEWFKNTIEAFQIDCYTASEKQALPPLEKVINSIAERDFLVAIIPENRSSWIDSEIGMAIALNKPVIAFYENKEVPSGPYKIIADYVIYDRNSIEKSTYEVIQLLNSLVRKLDAKSMDGPVQNFLIYKLLPNESEIQKKLIEMLDQATKTLDIWAYSTETFLRDDFLTKLLERKGINVRILIRDPNSDPKKGLIIRGRIESILSAFKSKRMNINLYKQEPLIRCAIFDSSFGLFGIYRWNPDTYYEFIGAENNALVELKKDSAFGKLWIELIESRFDYALSKGIPFGNMKLN